MLTKNHIEHYPNNIERTFSLRENDGSIRMLCIRKPVLYDEMEEHTG